MNGTGLEVRHTGLLATVQDLGRPGLAELGVGRSGAADHRALRLANRLVGNPPAAAGIEVTLGGLSVVAVRDLLVALTGAHCPLTGTPGRGAALNAPFHLHAGDRLDLGVPTAGLRTYLAVRGGIDVRPVLGSRSSDLLAGIGPAPLTAGDLLPVGTAGGSAPAVDIAPVREPEAGVVELAVHVGPRDDWFAPGALTALTAEPYEVSAESNRIGMRLLGAELARSRTEELPSEGMVPGALQVPPSGLPTLLLADAPVTGGYPVIAVVAAADLDRAAQCRPGQQVRFRLSPGPATGRRSAG